jgi:sugar lactone lactonase YvrE
MAATIGAGGRRATVLAVLALLAASLAGCTSAPPGHPSPARPSRVVTSLERPTSLATGPAGQLYIADDARNQILVALPGGRFRVIAGNGQAGFSGDGGPAVDATLNDPGGMAVTRSGALYFADTGNNRIRVISPGGIISTVAGNGRWGNWVANGTSALRASLGGPADVAFAPDGALYIADSGVSEILELTRAGRLRLVAGIPTEAGLPQAGLQATRTPADGANGLAFDRAGDLFVAGRNTKALFMISPSGRVSLPIGAAGFYPRGDGGLVTGPDGSVLAMNTQQVDRLTSHGVDVLYNVPAYPRIGVTGFLPDGIAVAPDGALYLDTWSGNGWAAKTALIEIGSAGTVSVLWAS